MTRTAKMDRLFPTERPAEAVRGYQQWRSLLFMHWEVPVEVLRPLVPGQLELDLYGDRAYVGVVPFAMQGVRPRWWPKRLAFHFLETNVRTYVYRGDQPGIYFFSLEAASRLAVWAARRFWRLPYYYAEMSMQQEGDEVEYVTRRRGTGARHRVRYQLGEMLGPSPPDTLEFFLLERYLLFTEHHEEIYVGRVHHSPYPAQRAKVLHIEDELLEAAGFGPCEELPATVHYASGVDVEIFGLHRCT